MLPDQFLIASLTKYKRGAWVGLSSGYKVLELAHEKWLWSTKSKWSAKA